MADTRSNAAAERLRCDLMGRWLALVDMVWTLQSDVRDAAREGAFTADELRDAELCLDHAWDALANERPRFRLGCAPRALNPMLGRFAKRLAERGVRLHGDWSPLSAGGEESR